MKYDEIIKKMEEEVSGVDEQIIESQNENSEYVDPVNVKYEDKFLESISLQQSEMEAITQNDKQFYKVVAKSTDVRLTYTGNTFIGPSDKVERETISETVHVEARNYNQWSKSINDMDPEERKLIQRKAMANIHSGEDKISNGDIRTRIVNNRIEFIPKYSEEESKRRFKFTRTNEVDMEHQIPLCKFFINDELIMTINMEKIHETPFTALETVYGQDPMEKKLNDMELLCHEIYKRTSIPVTVDELFGYLESGYLINGEL